MRVLVTGATAFVGERLVLAIVERGHIVRALVRNAAGYDAHNDVEVTANDFSQPRSFEASLAGIDAACSLVRLMGAGGDFGGRDRRAPHDFADAAGKRGINRVICLGGFREGRGHSSTQLPSRRETERIRRSALVLRSNV